MDAWIGPAIIAAFVSGIVSVLGWIVTFRTSVRLDELRRAEKVRDFQIALEAEIGSDLLNMEVADRAAFLRQVEAEFKADPAYVPFVPRLASNVVFEAVVKEVHILPARVIAPVIDYARLRQTLERFVEDLRGETFRTLSAERKLAMYADYLATFDRLQALAQNARLALEFSLALSSSDEGRSSPDLASGPGRAWEQDAT